MNAVRGSRNFSFFRTSKPSFESQKRIRIIGNGVSGLVASALIPSMGGVEHHQIQITSPRLQHSFDSGLQFVAGGIMGDAKIEAPVLSVFNPLNDFDFREISKIDPENSLVSSLGEKDSQFDFLVLASGSEPDYEAIKGLSEALKNPKSGVVANETLLESLTAKSVLDNFYQGGRLLFVAPGHEKTRRYFEAHNLLLMWRDALKVKGTGLLNSSELVYVTEEPTLFSADPRLSIFLGKNLQEKGVSSSFSRRLVQIDSETKEATFLNLKTNQKEKEKYDLLFVSVPQRLPSILSSSGLLDGKGRLDVSPETLTHNKYPNIFALGTSLLGNERFSSLSGTIEQGVVIGNRVSLKIRKESSKQRELSHDGFNSQAIYTGDKRLMHYESNNEGAFAREFQPSSLSLLEEIYYSPFRYNQFIRKGKWFGRTGFRRPSV